MNWIEHPDFSIPDDYRSAIGGAPLVAQTLFRRGLTAIPEALAFLEPGRYTPRSPLEMPGMERAVERIEKAIRDRETILVWGDFDVDGQTATALLVSTLRELGGRVSYHIPVRVNESHGVGVAVLEKLLQRKDAPVGLVLTCDTGIAAHEAVDHAQGRGVDVVITDHHELPPTLPGAYAVVNPRLLPQGHALGGLPGVGVAYKLAEELYRRAGRPESAEALLDLAALGIVADVAQQTGETRYLLQRGLALLRGGPRLGLQVMMELAELNPAHLNEEHLGFSLGPRLNAIGRLDDANPAVELLTTRDAARARTLAHQLEALNSRRQLITSQVYRGALAQIEADPALLESAALVLAHPSWPAGVIGIVASRLVERFHRPVVMIATPEGAAGRASARSVEGVDITAAIAGQADLLEGFGGHAMAAGFAIQPENIASFRRGLSRAVQKAGLPPEAALTIDGFVGLDELTLDLVSDLERLAPFGAGNPPLVLATRGVRLLSQAAIGRAQEHLMLIVEDEQGVSRKVMWWQGVDELGSGSLPEGPFDLAYTVRASTYRGLQDVQITLRDYRQSQAQIVLQAERRPEALDCRKELYPLAALEKLLADESILVWAEAATKQRLADALPSADALPAAGERLCNRLELAPCHTLAIWSIPPGRFELAQALQRCRPRRVALFAADPEVDQLEAFLKRLVGLVKYAISSTGGHANLERLAAAMAHRPATVRAGLEWIAAQGLITVEDAPEGMLLLDAGAGEADAAQRESAPLLIERLKALLDETAAFRAFYRRAPADAIL